MKRTILLLITILSCELAFATQIVSIRGRVSCDKRGIAGVVVTDGEHFTTTDSKGRYRLDADAENRFVYISTPAGYESPAEQGVTRYYLPIGAKHHDFTLLKRTQDDISHGFVAIADPQIWAQKEFRMLGEAADDIAATVNRYGDRPFFGICCGDIISHDHSFYPEYNATIGRSGLVFRNAIGNHDMKVYGRSFETSFAEFERMYGPTYYSFNVGKVHYVVLNDNFFIGRDYFYIGYLDERQLRWLERDLSYLAPGSTVVVCLHIPSTCEPEDRKQFRYSHAGGTMANHRGLYNILKPYKTHIISGHTHTTYHQILSDSLREQVLPALSGAWWQGELCTDGTPRGYGVFTVDDGAVSWYYQSTGHPADYQMALYDGAQHSEFEGFVVANIWASDPLWQVELRTEGQSAIPMERFEAYDPAARRMYANTDKFDHKWIYPSKSDHFYRAARPAAGGRVEIVATDSFGREYSETLDLK